jgi:hypothetical protein
VKRDYSAVQWPWDDDPCWGAPREGATSDPADDANWRLACIECGLYFPKDIEIGVAADHWKTLHYPDWTYERQEPELQLNLVWVGLGTPPQPKS